MENEEKPHTSVSIPIAIKRQHYQKTITSTSYFYDLKILEIKYYDVGEEKKSRKGTRAERHPHHAMNSSTTHNNKYQRRNREEKKEKYIKLENLKKDDSTLISPARKPDKAILLFSLPQPSLFCLWQTFEKSSITIEKAYWMARLLSYFLRGF